MIAVARNSDLILMMLDSGKSDRHRELLTAELEAVGIRLNVKPPDVYFKQKSSGGQVLTVTCNLDLPQTVIKSIMQEFKIHNYELIIRENISIDQLIDVVTGNRKYIRCLYCYNKIDTLTIQQVDVYARQPHSVVISCNWNLGLDYLVDMIWNYLGLIRIYTKPRGRAPDFLEPLILPANSSVQDVCLSIHKSLVANFKYAAVFGASAKHIPQRVGLSHVLADEDVVQIMTAGK